MLQIYKSTSFTKSVGQSDKAKTVG